MCFIKARTRARTRTRTRTGTRKKEKIKKKEQETQGNEKNTEEKKDTNITNDKVKYFLMIPFEQEDFISAFNNLQEKLENEIIKMNIEKIEIQMEKYKQLKLLGKNSKDIKIKDIPQSTNTKIN